jgi:PAS domain S-box-containing protein
MQNQIKIAIIAVDSTTRNSISETLQEIDFVLVASFDFNELGWNALLDFNPDVVICRHDGTNRNCEYLLHWIDSQALVRKVTFMVIVDKEFAHVVSESVQNRVDQLLFDMPDDHELLRNVRLLIRLVRSENEIMRTHVLNESLAVSEDKYRTIVDSLDDGYFEVDETGMFKFLNASMERILAMDSEQVVGKKVDEILTEQSATRLFMLIGRVQHYRIHIRGERLDVKTANGRHRVVEISLMLPEPSSVSMVRCLARDVTTIREVELEVAKKEEEFRTAINSAKEAFYMFKSLRDKDGNIIDFIFTEVNKAGFDLLNFSADQVIGARLCELLPVNREPRFFDRYVKVVETREIIDEEYQIDIDTFKPKWAHHTVVPITDGIAITVRDVTDIKNTSRRIEADRNLLNTIINAIPDEIYLKDKERRFVMVNRGVLNMLERKSFDEVVGKRDEDLIASHFLDMLIEQDQMVLESGIPLINFEGYAYTDETQTEIRRSMLVSKLPYFDNEGHIIGLIGINRDITDRKRAELRIKRSLREKEVLLKEIHHRVKNNLAVISGLLFMQAEYIDNDDMKQVLYDSEIRIRSMAMIHEKLYHHELYSGIEFGAYVKDLVSTIEKTYHYNGCEITVNFNTPTTYIDLNRAMPCALIVNEVLSNAYKHAFHGMDKGEISIDFSQHAGTYRLAIKDNGIGLPAIFKPEQNQSLGMTLIYGLVSQLGSELQIDTSDGTKFSFEFGGEEKSPW